MTTETLKPCPFCGGRAALSTFKKRIGTACKHTVIRQHAVCKVCSAQTRVFKALDRAPRAWNRRQTDADRLKAQAKTIEALQADKAKQREALVRIALGFIIELDDEDSPVQVWLDGEDMSSLAHAALEKQP